MLCILLRPKKQDQTLLWTCVTGACGGVNSRYAKFKIYRNEIRLHPNYTMLSTVGDLTISKFFFCFDSLRPINNLSVIPGLNQY